MVERQTGCENGIILLLAMKSHVYPMEQLHWEVSFVVSPAKPKRDICTAFPGASLSSSSAVAGRKLFCV